MLPAIERNHGEIAQFDDHSHFARGRKARQAPRLARPDLLEPEGLAFAGAGFAPGIIAPPVDALQPVSDGDIALRVDASGGVHTALDALGKEPRLGVEPA